MIQKSPIRLPMTVEAEFKVTFLFLWNGKPRLFFVGFKENDLTNCFI